ncbi:MAG: hypothetical protein FJ134_11345 [Deltaproteobacteria bacterium]|nr:hypothetical protein [Deltaproteobacteria bacterium]
MIRFSDKEIDKLIKEPKVLPVNFQEILRLRSKRGHSERDIDIKGDDGSDFRLILRQNKINPLDFSVILAYSPQETTQEFRLCRYNGKSHQHTNSIENVSFYDFHIHKATERYQDIGSNEESYAEPTSRFTDLNSALHCLLADCNIQAQKQNHPTLFDEL